MAESSTNGKGKDEAEDARPPNSGRSTTTHESAPGDGADDRGYAEDDLDVLKRGATVGRYLVLERLGTGAMGVVYAAYDPELDRKVAIKLLRPSEGRGDPARRQARLVREAKAMAKLSHANVGAIFDVGVHDGQVFLAIEYLPGGTLRDWLAAEKRPWREIVRMFIEVGNGLAAAHAEGLIHRDFKPDNVLLDKAGKPKVVDFGLVRLTAALDVSTTGSIDASATGSLDDPDLPVAETAIPSASPIGPAALTRTGALAGTPAYMAPEQFLGKPVHSLTDQFAFCVALYEALYGTRPFSGETVFSLADAVTSGSVQPPPKDSAVPAWLRRLLLTGLATQPLARWPSLQALTTALGDDPAIKLRRRLLAAGVLAALGGTLLGARHVATQRRADTERQISRHLDDAATAVSSARTKLAAARDIRRRAFAAFDSMNPGEGELLWQQALALIPGVDSNYDQGGRDFDAAYVLDRSRGDIQARLADLRLEHLLFAEDFRLVHRLEVLTERLANADVDGSKRKVLLTPGTLVLHTSPSASRILLERFERDPSTNRRVPRLVPGRISTDYTTSLPAGSYRLLLDGPGLAHVAYTFEIQRGERQTVTLPLPAATEVPEGFVYIPSGDFWFGDSDETLRTQFFNTVPLHRRHTDPFLIARHETTYAEWIAFLNSQSEPDQRRYSPHVSTALRGSLALTRRDQRWEISFEPMARRYRASEGEVIAYRGRKANQLQNWLHFPVAGISPQDVERYVTWLGATTGVSGLRLCTELEWEHAAKGADDRLFPDGDVLGPNDANHDATYGRVNEAYGPDVVGLHPGSRGPFEIDDLTGNVFEFVTSSQASTGVVIRGGAYQFGAATCRNANREPVPDSYRDVTAGFRLCRSMAKGLAHASQ